jgi:hypothetical protein
VNTESIWFAARLIAFGCVCGLVVWAAMKRVEK